MLVACLLLGIFILCLAGLTHLNLQFFLILIAEVNRAEQALETGLVSLQQVGFGILPALLCHSVLEVLLLVVENERLHFIQQLGDGLASLVLDRNKCGLHHHFVVLRSLEICRKLVGFRVPVSVAASLLSVVLGFLFDYLELVFITLHFAGLHDRFFLDFFTFREVELNWLGLRFDFLAQLIVLLFHLLHLLAEEAHIRLCCGQLLFQVFYFARIIQFQPTERLVMVIIVFDLKAAKVVAVRCGLQLLQAFAHTELRWPGVEGRLVKQEAAEAANFIII